MARVKNLAKNRKHLQALAAANRGIPRSPEVRRKISDGTKGAKNGMWGKRGSQSPNWGLKRSDETKAKISAANTRRKIDPEVVAKLAAARRGRTTAMLGKKDSTETRQAKSIAQTQRWKRDSPYGALRTEYPIHYKHFTYRFYTDQDTDLTLDAVGLLTFIKEIGPIPEDLKSVRISVGRRDHTKGYVSGNYFWQSLSDNAREGNVIRKAKAQAKNNAANGGPKPTSTQREKQRRANV